MQSRRGRFQGKVVGAANILFTDHWGNNWAATGREVAQKKYPVPVC